MGATDHSSHPDQADRADPAVTFDRRHWTTIVLEEQADGRWLATQTGVSVAGHGDTAAAAATAYCRKISEAGDG